MKKNIFAIVVCGLLFAGMIIGLLNSFHCFDEEVETYDFHATVVAIDRTNHNYHICFVDGSENGCCVVDDLTAINNNELIHIKAVVSADLFNNETVRYFVEA